jgi:hypothetical protein
MCMAWHKAGLLGMLSTLPGRLLVVHVVLFKVHA